MFCGLNDGMAPNAELEVTAVRADGSEVKFKVVTRLDTVIDVEYYRNGGILHTVLRERLS